MGTFNAGKTKVLLKLSVNRLKLLQQKKTMISKSLQRDVATLLENGKEESARIKVEGIIREDLMVEALELLENYCELLSTRFGLLETNLFCDPAISEAVNTVIWAAPRSGVKEIMDIKDQLVNKFGRDFAFTAANATNDSVNARVIQKLQIQTPSVFLVNEYLKTIAEMYKVKYEGKESSTGVDMTLGIGSIGMPQTPQQFNYPQQPFPIPQGYPEHQFPTPEGYPQQQHFPTQQGFPQQQPDEYQYPQPLNYPTESTLYPPQNYPQPPSMQPGLRTLGSGNVKVLPTGTSSDANIGLTGKSNEVVKGDQDKEDEGKEFKSMVDFDALSKRFEALKKK